MNTKTKVLTPAIAAAYWRAEVLTKEDGIVKMHGLQLNLLVGELPKFQHGYYAYNSCQLILTPLDEITDEDAIEVAKMAMYHPSNKEDWENIICSFIVDEITRLSTGVVIIASLICWEGSININYDGFIEIKNEEGENEVGGIWNYASIIDFLRSRHYDCGYGSIPSLIAADLAVSKSKIIE